MFRTCRGRFANALACTILASITIQLAAHAEEKSPVSTSTAPLPKQRPEISQCPEGIFETVPIFYLDTFDQNLAGTLASMKPTSGCGQVVEFNIGSPRSVAIYGNEEGRESLKRFIGSFDLPRERVNMDLWAIQISSSSPAKLSNVVDQVQRVVDQTREAMQKTYEKLSELSYDNIILDPSVPELQSLHQLGFSEAVPPSNEGPPLLSLTQMLLRLQFAKDPAGTYKRAAQDLCNFFAEQDNHLRFRLFNEFEGKELKVYDIERIFNDDLPRSYRRPFQGFMEKGLKQNFDRATGQPTCGDGQIKDDVQDNLLKRRNAIRRFAEAYYNYRVYSASGRSNFDPSELAKSASIVDGMIGPIVDAINQDIEAYFIRPTLFKIRQIVGRNRSVEYAEVGRSSIAGINGQKAKISSGTISSFDEPTPLRLGDLLTQANKYLGKDEIVPTVLPNLKGIQPGTLGATALLGSLPTQSAVALLAALSEEKVRWGSLNSGLELTLLPILMRDQTQAEVKVDLTLADPALFDASKDSTDPSAYGYTRMTSSEGNSMRPLSRVAKSVIDTKVYINTMDLFALSSFSKQTTITGRRWYVPLIGTIWEGAFGDIPVVGGWFSFKRQPQNVHHQSLILANTLIVPSAMGMASYYSQPGTNMSYKSNTNPIGRTPRAWQIRDGSF